MVSHSKCWWIVAAATAALSLTGCVRRTRAPQPLTVAASGLELSDAAVSEAVKNELLAQAAIPPDAVRVTTDQGVVRLEGTVPNLLAKNQAAREAESVRGVRALVNLLQVDAERRPDELIEADVREALAHDPATADETIEVDVRGGKALLKGLVDSPGERDLVAWVASSVVGLRSIENEIALRSAASRSDEDIRQEIAARLHWDALVNGTLVRVAVQDGRVTLQGTLGSLAAKRRLERTAWVRGVRELDAHGVEIAWWARDPGRRSLLTRLDDRELEAAVRAALAEDPRVQASTVDVHSFAGKIVLSGSVTTLSEKDAATRAAEATLGVSEVENHLTVRATLQNPEQTRERIARAFTRHPYLDREKIDVQVQNGTAVLRGQVRSSFERVVAEQVTAREPGVVRVDNQLTAERVEPLTLYDPYAFTLTPLVHPRREPGAEAGTYLSDMEIEKRVRRELLWSPLVDATQIDVEVHAAVATLRGVVMSRAEMLAAINNALQGGAMAVDNRMVTTH